jgi:hypothetical protein
MPEEVQLVIPVEKRSKQLDRTVDLVRDTAASFALDVPIEPDVNVAEARQMAMERCQHRYICFLDYDSEMIEPGWLDVMLAKMREHEDAAVVFAQEWWGTEPKGPLYGPQTESDETYFGPAACMLIDRQRLPAGITWDGRIGLRNGWIGGDFEERDFCMQVISAGLKMYQAPCMFHHVCRSTISEWEGTDRFKTADIMGSLIAERYATAPEDRDWYKGLTYVPARKDDDRMLAPGHSVYECFGQVVKRNGLKRKKFARRYYLGD